MRLSRSVRDSIARSWLFASIQPRVSLSEDCRASLGRTAGGGCPYMVLGVTGFRFLYSLELLGLRRA